MSNAARVVQSSAVRAGNVSTKAPAAARAHMRTLRRSNDVATDTSGMPLLVQRALRSSGQPLDRDSLGTMQTRFGHDFSSVRVHTGSLAAQSARAIDANAYTVGNDVVFAEGKYAPTTNGGRRLLAHELAHVVQQSSATHTERSVSGEPTSGPEGQAAPAADRVVAGTNPGPHGAVSARTIQREPASSGGMTGKVIDTVLSASPVGGTQLRMLAAAVRGMVSKMFRDLSGVRGIKLLGHLKSFTKDDAPKFYGGYLIGLGLGIVSPITDLFGLAVMAEQINGIGRHIIESAISNRDALAAEAKAVVASFNKFAGDVKAEIAKLKVGAGSFIETLLGLPGVIEKVGLDMAYGVGEGAGDLIIKSLEEPWEDKKPAGPAPAWSDSPLARTSTEAGNLVDSATTTPWAKAGRSIGYAIGFSIVQVALLLLSDGIGNTIVKIGGSLGKLGEGFSLLAKGAEKLGAVVKTVGSVIAEVEKGIALVTKVVFKPFERLLKPLGEVFEGLQKFLQRLLGMEKSAASAATGGAKTVITQAEKKVAPALAPKPSAAPHPSVKVVEPPKVIDPLPKAPAPPPVVKAPEPTALKVVEQPKAPVSAPEAKPFQVHEGGRTPVAGREGPQGKLSDVSADKPNVTKKPVKPELEAADVPMARTGTDDAVATPHNSPNLKLVETPAGVGAESTTAMAGGSGTKKPSVGASSGSSVQQPAPATGGGSGGSSNSPGGRRYQEAPQQGVHVPPDEPHVGVDPRVRGFAIEDAHIPSLSNEGYSKCPDRFKAIDAYRGGKSQMVRENGRLVEVVTRPDVVSVKSTNITHPERLTEKVTADLDKLRGRFEWELSGLRIEGAAERRLDLIFDEGVDVTKQTAATLKQLQQTSGNVKLNWWVYKYGRKIPAAEYMKKFLSM